MKARNRTCKKHNVKKVFIGGGTRGLHLCRLCIEEGSKASDEQREKNKLERYKSYLEKSNIPLRFKEQPEFKKPTVKHQEIFRNAMDIFYLKGVTGMVFIGGLQRGKTLLACLIGKRFMQRCAEKNIGDNTTDYHVSVPCLYTTLLDMTLEIGGSIKLRNKTIGVLNKFAAPELLIVDEVGLQYGNDSEYLFTTNIIDKRYGAQKPTILIGNLVTKEVKKTIGDKAYRKIIEKGRVLPFDCEEYKTSD